MVTMARSVSWIAILFTAVNVVNTEDASLVSLNRCSGFKDHRDEEKREATIDIPPYLLNNNKNNSSLHFRITDTVTGLYCEEDSLVPYHLEFSDHQSNAYVKGKNFITLDKADEASPSKVHFAANGYFYDKHNFYAPHRFCIKSIFDTKFELLLCPVHCDEPNSICIPKCCGVDEILRYPILKCRKLYPEEPTWRPDLYSNPRNKLNYMLDDESENQTTNSLTTLYFHRPNFHKCKVVGDRSNAYINEWSVSDVQDPEDNSTIVEKSDVRLVNVNGRVKPYLFNSYSRKWDKKSDVQFCADGYFVKDPANPDLYYPANSEHQVILYCQDVEGEDPSVRTRSWIYAVIAVVSSIFLLAIIIVYLVLLDKQGLNGIITLSYCVCLFLSYVFSAVAHFISLYPNPEFTGIYNRGWFCMTIAIGNHYLFLSSYVWLAILNFDVWVVFRSVKAVARSSKELGTFTRYSAVGWGLPLALIIAFVIVDIVYRDPKTEVPVPNYALSTCYVSPEFRIEYLYAPMCIFLIINFILIVLTMKIIWSARQSNITSSVSNTNRYSAVLFLKLFVLMGGVSAVDVFTWYYNKKPEKPWIVVVIEVISYLAPAALFVLLCMNKRVFNQLEEKFPKQKRFLRSVRHAGKKTNELNSKNTSADSGGVNLESRGSVDSTSTQYSYTSASDKK